MLRQSLVCVAVENEQCCVTGVINSLQQPVFTVSLRSIDNPLARFGLFSQLLLLILRKQCVVHTSRALDCVSLKITEMAIITSEYTRSRHGS